MTTESSQPPASAEPPDWEALARFIAGESDHAEAEAIAAYLAAHPEDANILAVVKQSAAALGREVRAPVDTEAALATVQRRRDERASVPPEIVPRRVAQRAAVPLQQRAWWQTPYAAAAAMLLVAAATVWWSSVGSVGPAQTVQMAAAAGERDSLELPDGTRVLLGPGSTLSYASDYGADSREVTLTGDGYFDVQPDAARAFTVRAGDAVVVDLSTAFTVRTDDSRGVQVAVTSGRVRLLHSANPTAALELAAGETGLLGTSRQTPERTNTDTSDALAWTRGELAFVDAPMADVVVALRRWYALTVRLDSTFADQRLTGRFDGESRDIVLNAIALSLGADWAVRGDTASFRQPSNRAR